MYNVQSMLRCLLIVVLTITLFSSFGTIQSNARQAPTEGFAHPAIQSLWERDDGPVAAGRANRSWMWGPGPFFTNYEPFQDLPLGNHLVQYFDKGRLEINDPAAEKSSPWFVSSGVLVKEMVEGKIDTGGGQSYNLKPSAIPVAGDGGADSGPTYANFSVLTGRAANLQGQLLADRSYLRPNGTNTEIVTMDPPVPVRLERYEQASGHNWADVFWKFSNSAGFPWLQTLGYPITEPYWIITTVNGKRQTVLVQLFERRTLTFNPSNSSTSQVEMGNVGRHYFQWRYADHKEATLDSKYDVHIKVGSTPQRSTSVEQVVDITNSTGKPLKTVVLRTVWHHWDGVFSLKSASAGGKSASSRWLYGINLELTLADPLMAGQSARLALDYDLKPRPVGGRTGYDRSNDILGLGDMLPTVVPWENGGWLYYPYSDLGDLGYYASSDYTVEVASSVGEKLVVGGTGQIDAVSADHSSWTFTAKNVRDAAYVVSPRFINPLEDASMTLREGSTLMLAYFLPEHRSDGQRQLQLTGPALSWFSRKIGSYPFGTYTVAEMGVPLERTDNYAQEYPMAYFIPTSWLKLGTSAGSWTWYTPVHEVGHQWFYSTVGNNQLVDPWLDEALATYMTAEYVRDTSPALYQTAWASMTKAATRAMPVSAGVFSGFASENEYSASIYDSGALMLDRIRRAMGDAAFYDALRHYSSTYRFRRATPANLQTILQSHSTADLKPVFSEYLGY